MAEEHHKIKAYPKQQAFITDDARAVSFTAGVGAGKTFAGATRLLLKSQPNCTYMIAVPTFNQLDRATLPAFKEVCDQFGLWTKDSYREVKRTVSLDNGAHYLLSSCDHPETLRGPTISGAWCDELQDTKEEAYFNILARLRQHGKRGWIQSTFTPGSPDHWTSKRFIKNCTIPTTMKIDTSFGPATIKYFRNQDGSTSFFRASTKENTFLEPAYYQGLLADYASSPMRIRRELEGECIYLKGAEWEPEYFDNVMFNEWPTLSRDGIKVIALDSSLGKEGKGEDYAAYIKCQWQDGLLYVDADMKPRQASSTICQTGVELYKDWKPHYFVVEEEMGMNLLIAELHRIADEQNLVMAITPMGSDHINKEVRIRRLTPYVSRKLFRFKSNSPGAKMLMDQMLAFPLAEHDDGPDCLEYAIRMLVKATTGQVCLPRQVLYTPLGNVFGTSA